ncbi:MAG TPA: polymer-forming cytoskeletal protein [Polyangiaceae bacterium]|jgi:cytoskeletal protein CcmA (bactofilin family)|nr:polymer-forming cytoskeletal protein [Polyangiaceae bacterium]
MEKQTAKQTLVEEGTELKGTLKSSCQVVVNGKIDGEIVAPSLTVTASGTVLGTVRAQKLRSEGTLAGDIDADDVYLSGTVRSNTMIRAKKLEVKLGTDRGKLEVSFGECMVEVGEDPAHAAEAKPAVAAEAKPAASTSMALAPAPLLGPDARWSEPAGAPAASPAAEAASAAETNGASKDDKRGKKTPERRDSQAPPAS